MAGARAARAHASSEEGTTALIPRTMWAVRLQRPGGPEGLVVERVPTPQARAGEALVRVHAAAITRDELDWPTDRLPAIPSYELSGVVASAGADLDPALAGKPVYALLDFDRDGAAAEFVAVEATLLAPKPPTLDHVESAAVPLAALSAWQGLFDHGALAEGQRLLIHGAAGGVGHFATQLARGAGAYVIGTASRGSLARARSLGAHEVVDDGESRFDEVLDPVDLVFDTVGGDLLRRSPAILRSGGRLVSVAEEPPEPSSESGIEATYFVVEPNRDELVEIGALADSGGLRPSIDSVFELAEAQAAFARIQATGKHGKVVLRVIDD